MAARITLLDDFLRRVINVESDSNNITPFTWLIGAGVSASSGIPLATHVSKRIILYEYLVELDGSPPWKEGLQDKSIKPITYNTQDIEDFLKWFQEAEKNEKDFDNFLKPALDWLKGKEHFSELNLENPKYYQLIFKHLFYDKKTSIKFLTTLIKQAEGVNLAHLGLAGLLRDYPEWGKTVFTTNFDDLLLKALLQLDHSARVFGEYETGVKAGTKPNYPQIVYLHGKHTGYNLLNSKEQIALINPVLQESFKAHIADSNLLVLGYSGWDDLVMTTLKEWNTNPELIRGTLYWIPWKSENEILPHVRDFLDALPSGSVHIIVNKERNLNADSFILALCNEINKKNGGFAPYRKEILNIAKKQHSFIISALKNYPEFDPEKALDYIREAKACIITQKNEELALNLLLKAETLILSDDLPDRLRAKAFQGIGIIHLLMRDYTQAKQSLEKALSLYKGLEDIIDENDHLEKIKTYRAIAEAYFYLNDIENAKINLSEGLYQIKKEKITDKRELLKFHLLYAKINMLRGYIEHNENLIIASELIEVVPDEILKGEYNLLDGCNNLLQGRHKVATSKLSSAVESFNNADYEIGIANAKTYLAANTIISQEYESASIYLIEALEIFKRKGDKLGCSNIYSLYGDLFFQKGELDNAIGQYNLALDNLDTLHFPYNLVNIYVDLCRVYKEAKMQDNFNFVNQKLMELNTTLNLKNPYAKQKLVEFTNSKPHTDEEE